jgi:hypothetical protein
MGIEVVDHENGVQWCPTDYICSFIAMLYDGDFNLYGAELAIIRDLMLAGF